MKKVYVVQFSNKKSFNVIIKKHAFIHPQNRILIGKKSYKIFYIGKTMTESLHAKSPTAEVDVKELFKVGNSIFYTSSSGKVMWTPKIVHLYEKIF